MSLIKKLPMILLVVFIILAPLGSVKADGAPPPDITSLGGIGPLRFQSTEVQMVYERVEMELLVSPDSTSSNYPVNLVSVTAWFIMRNEGDADENMQVIFPLDNINDCISPHDTNSVPQLYSSNYSYKIQRDSFNVAVNGLSEPTTDVTTPNLDTGPCAPPTMNWAGFNVSFPVGQDVLIRVNYMMSSEFYDTVERVQYILETGAAWHGPIGRADIIFRFPYTVTSDNIIAPDSPYTGTTSGYTPLFNEIYWSYTDFEPTDQDNIEVAFLTPEIWQRVLSTRVAIDKNPHDLASWNNLIDLYADIARSGRYRDSYSYYHKKIDQTYRNAIAANPFNASMNAKYGMFLIPEISYPFDKLRLSDVSESLYYLNQAMALDPSDPDTVNLYNELSSVVANFAYTPPPSLPPTATPRISLTPTPTITGTETPTPTETFTPTSTPRPTLTSTPSRTLIPTSTATPLPTATNTPSPTPWVVDLVKGNNPAADRAAMLILAVIAGSGWLSWWLVRRKRG